MTKAAAQPPLAHAKNPPIPDAATAWLEEQRRESKRIEHEFAVAASKGVMAIVPGSRVVAGDWEKVSYRSSGSHPEHGRWSASVHGILVIAGVQISASSSIDDDEIAIKDVRGGVSPISYTVRVTAGEPGHQYWPIKPLTQATFGEALANPPPLA